jgi:hypothetical protein
MVIEDEMCMYAIEILERHLLQPANGNTHGFTGPSNAKGQNREKKRYTPCCSHELQE